MKPLFYIQIWACLCLSSCNQENQSSHTTDGTDITKKIVQKNEQVKDNKILEKYPVTTWLRMSPAALGCIFENELNYRDSVFNCSNKNYVNKGDPCKNTEAYYEGVQLPDSIATILHPNIDNLILRFEGGELQDMRISFKDSIAKSDVIKILQLPSKSSYPENIISISYGEDIISNDKPVNEYYTKWLTITGFEHMGAGDLDCE